KLGLRIADGDNDNTMGTLARTINLLRQDLPWPFVSDYCSWFLDTIAHIDSLSMDPIDISKYDLPKSVGEEAGWLGDGLDYLIPPSNRSRWSEPITDTDWSW